MCFTLSQIAANSGEAAQIGQHWISKAGRTEFPEKRFGWKPDRRMEATSVWFVEYRAQCAGGYVSRRRGYSGVRKRYADVRAAGMLGSVLVAR